MRFLIIFLLKFLFFEIPKILFMIAGLFKVINRGNRAFRKALIKEDVPKEVVDSLCKELRLDVKAIFKFLTQQFDFFFPP
ncbi:hypothetical protein PNA2_1475 [Pyrococcus sp. NA2]|nr:hypothetical protein PNA2_1475 [Pyrococcus sp. NA2]